MNGKSRELITHLHKMDTHFKEQEAVLNAQHFLLNFITSLYLGPDVYSDNPRRSVMQRIHENSPPYTSKNLGSSFITISQLVSLYYYVLRNADSTFILEPSKVYRYIKGYLHSGSLTPFTRFFPLNIHEFKKYSSSYEIVKGIVVIDDPVVTFMRTNDLERFKQLSRLDGLKIDVKESLSYNTSEPVHLETYKRRRREPLDGSTTNVLSGAGPAIVEPHGEGSSCKAIRKLDEPVSTPVRFLCKIEDFPRDNRVILTGTAKAGLAGPPIGMVDIGISTDAYFFCIALPGVRRDFCEFICEIESDGKVHIEGSIIGEKTVIKKRSRVFVLKFKQMCPPGPFTLSFNLPGPVDPRLFSPNFRTDGIFEAVVIKQKQKEK